MPGGVSGGSRSVSPTSTLMDVSPYFSTLGPKSLHYISVVLGFVAAGGRAAAAGWIGVHSGG